VIPRKHEEVVCFPLFNDRAIGPTACIRGFEPQVCRPLSAGVQRMVRSENRYCRRCMFTLDTDPAFVDVVLYHGAYAWAEGPWLQRRGNPDEFYVPQAYGLEAGRPAILRVRNLGRQGDPRWVYGEGSPSARTLGQDGGTVDKEERLALLPER